MDFSVIATCFNDEKIITDYFKNMKEQTVQPIEYILVDGGSKDNTVQVVRQFVAESGMNIRIISGKRLNIAQGYNVGIKESSTEIVIITGVGNTYDSFFFEALLEEHIISGSEVVYGITYGTGESRFSKVYRKLFLGDKNGIHPFPTNRGQLVNRRVFDRIGYFYEHFIYAGEDTEYYLIEKLNGIKISYTEKAKIFWDVPKSFKEYRKQKKLYTIGDLQIYGIRKKVLKRPVLMLLGILCFVMISIIFGKIWWAHLWLPILYLFISVKLGTLGPMTIAVKIFDTVSIPFYYFLLRNYGNDEYRVRR